MERSHYLSLLIWSLCLFNLFPHTSGYQQFENIRLSREASVTTSFSQDSAGLLWVGTNKGLYSYDGYNAYSHFNYGDASNSRIYCQEIVSERYLFLGTDNGLLCYDFRTLRYLPLPGNMPADIRALFQHNGYLWIGSLNGLFRYDIGKQSLTRYDASDYKGLTHNTIYCILADNNPSGDYDGRLYLGTYDGFCSFNPETLQFEKIPLPFTPGKNNLFVNSLLADPERNCIWVGTEGNLFCYYPQSGKSEAIEVFASHSIKSLALDGAGQLLLGTDNGLFIWNNGIFRHILHDSRNGASLSNDIIWNIFADRDRNIWLGTDDGISLSVYDETMRHVPLYSLAGTGEGNHFYSIFKDSRNRFWLGGTNGILRVGEISGLSDENRWYRVGNHPYSLPHNRIRHIYEDRDGTVWIASDGSINRYDESAERFIRYDLVDSTHRYNSNWAYHILEDRQERLWVSTCLGGIFIIDKRCLSSASKTCVSDYNINTGNGLSGMFINQLVSDAKGDVWVLLYNNGINRIDSEDLNVRSIDLGEAEEKNPNFLLAASDGMLWCAFRGGIMRIDPEDEKITWLYFDQASTAETQALEEVDGTLWAATTEGLWCIDLTDCGMTRLENSTETYTSLYYDGRDSLLYLGGADGVAIISPKEYLMKQSNHPVLLSALYVNNQLTLTREDKSIGDVSDFSFGNKENHLMFEVSERSFRKRNSSRLIYRLEGKDRIWNTLPVGANRIVYSGLDPGRYVLRVRRQGMADETGRSDLLVRFSIRTPWYATFWMKSLALLFLTALVIWIGNYIRVRNRLKRERQEKERVILQSKQKMEFFSNLSHDFKTPLSMIISPVSHLLLECEEKERESLELIRRNAMKLHSMIHQLLEFERIDRNATPTLLLSTCDLNDLCRSVFNGFQEGAFASKAQKSEFVSDQECIYAHVDLLKLQSILSNLLSNASKYTPAGGTIRCRLHSDGIKCRITVSDNGVGIPAPELPYVWQRFFQSSRTSRMKEGTGIGLYLVKAYTELHGGTADIVSEEGGGTSVTVALPLSGKEEKTENEPVPGEGILPNLLIVDDNPEIRSFLSTVFSKHFRCISVADGHEAIRHAMSEVPELVITDLRMPVMDGMEMVRRFRDNPELERVPVIMLTGSENEYTERESLKLGTDAFITKPFDAEILLLRALNLIRRKRDALPDPLGPEKEICDNPVLLSTDEKFLTDITKMIEERIDDFDLNVNFLSELMGINTRQLHRKLKQLTGLSPVEYIKTIRMKKAAMLLRQKKFTVSEVHYMVGFSNSSYFSKCFQSVFGKTPRQYMEEQ